MALSALDDKTREPTDRDVAAILGPAKGRWDEIVGHVAGTYGPITQEWASSGKAYGWSLRLKSKKRTILYLIPQHRTFLCAFVFGDKAVEAVLASSLPRPIIEAIEGARRYVEGRGIRVEVKTSQNLDTIRKLVAIKMAR